MIINKFCLTLLFKNLTRIFMNKFYKSLVFTLVLIFCCNNIFSQSKVGALVTNKTIFFINTGCVVYVDSTFHNEKDSLHNLGTLIVINDFINNDVALGNGTYDIKNNWENNKTFICGLSKVILRDTTNTPEIKGASITSFYDLILTTTLVTKKGSGKRKLSNIAIVLNNLDITDRELAIDQYDLIIKNVDVFAIKRTSGFISSDKKGWLVRYTAMPGEYLFPVGSSLITKRISPIGIKPNIAPNRNLPDTNQFAINLINNSGSIDGFNTRNHTPDSICWVDSLFYYNIKRLKGKDTVDLTVYYNQKTEGYWNSFSNWDGSKWSYINKTKRTYKTFQGDSEMYIGYVKKDWNNFSNYPYALVNIRPDSLPIMGPRDICSNKGTEFLTWGDKNGSYIWTLNGVAYKDTTYKATILTTKLGKNEIKVLQKFNNSTCNSLQSVYSVNVFPQPIAKFVTDSNNVYPLDIIHFIDSSKNATLYYWDFGDAMISKQQNPYHSYDNSGVFNVMLIVDNSVGCSDTAFNKITVKKGVFASSAFTPNGDGHNDNFYVKCGGCTSFRLDIYNRWGVLMFQSYSSAVLWDGKTQGGLPASEGTYYFILEAKDADGEYKQTGFFSLLR